MPTEAEQGSLEYLYRLQFFGIKLGLDNIRELLRRVGNPQQSLRIIHIAGTNGKGSTAAALAAILRAGGIPAGLYTSPHLHSFTERIRIDTRPISMAEVVRLIEFLRPHADALRVTFFEFATAMALLAFQQHGVEWAILETGMGGRLDATNVVSPELCLLTPIGLDHTQHLGETLPLIAAEKAGIIKPGVPLVCARQHPAAQAVIDQRAAELGTPMLLEGRDYHWAEQGEGFSFSADGIVLEQIEPGLAGAFQLPNLALAAAAARQLGNGSQSLISAAALREGLQRVRWPGRLEWLTERVLVDGAHNPAGAAMLASYLERHQLHNLHLVIGCKADKDFAGLLAPLWPFAARVYATRPPVDEALDPRRIVAVAQGQGLPATLWETPQAALSAALAHEDETATVLVAGSLFLVAAVREALVSTEPLEIYS